MKSWKALFSLLKVYPGNLQSWVMLVLAWLFFGWKGLLVFYALCILVVMASLYCSEEARKFWFSKNELGKKDWLVQRCCAHGLHGWGNVIEEDPKTHEARKFLQTRSGLMRVGSGICVYCSKPANLVSFTTNNQPYVRSPIFTGPISWHSWVEMSEGFYKMYRETQESAE